MVGVRGWRVAVILLVSFAMGVALALEIFASLASASSRWAGDQSLWLTSWLYQSAHVSTTGSVTVIEVHHGYPPLALWAALIAAILLLGQVMQWSQWALKKAGARATFIWSVPDERRRLAARLHDLGYSRRFVCSVHQRGLLACGGVASLAVALVSAYAIIGRTGALLVTGSAETGITDLSVGLGPWVCLFAGIIGVVGAAAAWPWTRQCKILIHADGNVEALHGDTELVLIPEAKESTGMTTRPSVS